MFKWRTVKQPGHFSVWLFIEKVKKMVTSDNRSRFYIIYCLYLILSNEKIHYREQDNSLHAWDALLICTEPPASCSLAYEKKKDYSVNILIDIFMKTIQVV